MAITKNEVAARLKQARAQLKMTQAQFGEPLNLLWNNIKDIEAGKKNVTSDLAIQIEKVHSINMRWLLTGEGDMFGGDSTGNQSNVVVFKNQVIIPVYRNITACGGIGTDNSYIDGELERQLPLPVDAIGTDDERKVYGLYVSGRSMENAGIPDGSIAVIRIIDDFFSPSYGAPCHVRYERDGFPVDAIKFYYPKSDGSGVTLRSAEGSGVPPVNFDREDLQRQNPCICGVVVSVVEHHKPQWGN